MISTRIVAAFSRNVFHEPNTGCWLWGGTLCRDGYGLFGRAEQLPRRAHRASYVLHVGPIPSGLVVRHRCDVRACVNPDHLEVGTQADNMQDAVVRGRTCRGDTHKALHPYEKRARGEAQGAAKLTDDTVARMRKSYADGSSVGAIARFAGVAKSTAMRAIFGRHWTHVAEPIPVARSISEAKAVARLRKGYTATLFQPESAPMEQTGLAFPEPDPEPIDREPEDEGEIDIDRCESCGERWCRETCGDDREARACL